MQLPRNQWAADMDVMVRAKVVEEGARMPVEVVEVYADKVVVVVVLALHIENFKKVVSFYFWHDLIRKVYKI